MARQGGRVQLEQSDMRLVFNMANMANEGLSRAAIQERKYLIKKPRAEVREVKKRGVEFPGHHKVKAVVKRHLATIRRNQTSRCLRCQNGIAKYPQTSWISKGTGAPPPTRRRVWTPQPTPLLPGTPPFLPTTTGNTSWAQQSELVDLPIGYTYLHTALPWAEIFEDDEDTEHYNNFDPDMLTDDG
jgi:hypothetical protein